MIYNYETVKAIAILKSADVREFDCAHLEERENGFVVRVNEFSFRFAKQDVEFYGLRETGKWWKYVKATSRFGSRRTMEKVGWESLAVELAKL